MRERDENGRYLRKGAKASANVPAVKTQADVVRTVGLEQLARQLTGTGNPNANAYFGPGLPPQPMWEGIQEPRASDYPVGYNLLFKPRSFEGMTFEAMKNFAEHFDIANIAINTIKKEIRDLEIAVRPKLPKGATAEQIAEAKVKLGPIITEVMGFLSTPAPDQNLDWSGWVNMALEQILVTDALSIYHRRTNAGDLYSMPIIDGATILPIIDQFGYVPTAPEPAYAQVIKGAVALLLDRTQLSYEPFNKRGYSEGGGQYGFSIIEGILVNVNRLSRREMYDLAELAEGTVPVAFVESPPGTTPEQLEELQQLTDRLMAGNYTLRSRMRYVMSGSKITFAPEHNAKDAAEEMLIMITLSAFGLSARSLGITEARSSMGGKGDAEAAEKAQFYHAIRPYARHIERVVNRIVAMEFSPEIECYFPEMIAGADSSTRTAENKDKFDRGIISMDDWRAQEDQDPIGMTDPVILDPKLGYVSLPLFLQQQENALKEAKHPTPPPDPGAPVGATAPAAPFGGGGKAKLNAGAPTDDAATPSDVPGQNTDKESPTPGLSAHATKDTTVPTATGKTAPAVAPTSATASPAKPAAAAKPSAVAKPSAAPAATTDTASAATETWAEYAKPKTGKSKPKPAATKKVAVAIMGKHLVLETGQATYQIDFSHVGPQLTKISAEEANKSAHHPPITDATAAFRLDKQADPDPAEVTDEYQRAHAAAAAIYAQYMSSLPEGELEAKIDTLVVDALAKQHGWTYTRILR